MNLTSVSLLRRALSDAQSDSWEKLASIYTPLLHVWIRKYALQASDADDLVQEVLLTVSRELPAFEHSGRTGAFRSWLRKILVHRLQHFWRSQKRQPSSQGGSSLMDQLREFADESSAVSHMWNVQHDQHVLAQLLEQIRPRFQEATWEAFRRQMFGGQKGRVVADELGISLKAVQLAKSRVLNALRLEAAGMVECE